MSHQQSRSVLPTSLAARLAIAFALLAVLLVAAFAFVIRDQADELLETQIRLVLRQAAAHTRNQLDRRMADFARDVRNRAEIDTIENPSSTVPLRRRSIDILRKTWPEFSWIAFMRPDGVVEQASDGILEGKNVSARPWFGNALARTPVTDVHEALLLQSLLGAKEPLRFVDIAYPVENAQGKVVAVLGVHVSWEFARQLVRRTQQLHYRLPGLEILIYDSKGAVLLGNSTEPKLDADTLRQASDTNEAVFIDQGEGRQRRLTAYSATRGEGEFPGLGWIVAVRQDTDLAYAPMRELDRKILYLGSGAVLLFALAGALLARRMVKPIADLTHLADRMREGERDVDFAAVDGVGEVKRLSLAMQSMVGALAQKERTLVETNASLEQRVAERTQSLAQTTLELDHERERLSLSLDGARVAAWDADPATGTIWLSSEWSVMLGGDRQDTRTTYPALLDLVPETDRERVKRIMFAVLQGELPFYDVEHMVRRQDGSLFWVRSRGTVPARAPDGRALRIAGTNTDITRRKMADDELRQSEEKLRLVTDNLPFMIAFLDRRCHFLFANRACRDFLGFSGQDLAGKPLRDAAGPRAHDFATATIPRLEAGEHVSSTRMRPDRHGRERVLDVLQIPHFDVDGKLAGFFAIVEDTTEKHEAARLLAAREAQLALLTSHIPVGVCEIDTSGVIQFANVSYDRLHGHAVGASIGRHVLANAGPDGAALLEKFAAGQSVEMEQSIAHSNGDTMHLLVQMVPRRSAEGTVESGYALVSDITARKQVEALLRAQALSDPLTGLPNRREFVDRLHMSLGQARRTGTGLGVLYLDLDGFKPVNDNLGHAAGDALLQEVARRLTADLRDGDTVARLGGDEFAVLLNPCPGEADAASVARKLIERLRPPMDVGAGTASVGVSIGIALYPGDGDNAATLLDQADQGLYAAKRGGRGHYARPPAAGQ